MANQYGSFCAKCTSEVTCCEITSNVPLEKEQQMGKEHLLLKIGKTQHKDNHSKKWVLYLEP